MFSATDQSICIVGTGGRTALGTSAPAIAAAVRAGVAAMGNHPFMIDKMGSPMVVCVDSTLPIALAMTDRCLELALNPAREALWAVIERCQTPPRVSVLLALPEQRPGMPEHFQNKFPDRLNPIC